MMKSSQPTAGLLETVYASSSSSMGKLGGEVVFERPGEEEMQTRLVDLRAAINESKLDWYVVPSEDEHQSEEVAESDKRREFITNFEGSAGVALIPSSSINADALLFTDSRYWVLAERAIPKRNWKVIRVGASGGTGRSDVVGGWADYVVDNLRGLRVGIDPKLVSFELARSIKSRFESTGTQLIPVAQNLVDKIHSPAPRSLSPLIPYPITLSGQSTLSKLSHLRRTLSYLMSNQNDWIYLLPTLPAIAWLLNFRCPDDIPFCPVAFAYVVLTNDRVVVFLDKRKLHGENDELKKDWDEAGVEVKGYGVEQVGKFVKEYLSEIKARNEKSHVVDVRASRESSWALVNACSPASVDLIPCPVDAAKALKNPVELQNFRNAYLRDGAAMVRWLSWLETKLVKEGKKVGEWGAAQVLTRFRRRDKLFAGLAYSDISVTGAHGASAHYVPTRETEVPIELESPYTIDSGPQYLDATIDTTRTMYFGKSPTDDMKRAYTRVLQGHMAVASATFLAGTDASAVGYLAKHPLHQDGLDFGHGLGHGVGNYLSVHESPVTFGRGFAFKAGHVTSIEPGFYLEGEWGMRLESVYICQSVKTKYEFSGPRWLGWERVTQVPFDTKLIDWSLMSKDEIRWLNEHNTHVQQALEPILTVGDEDKEAWEWLKRACKPKRIWPWTGK